jgi:hypothetical protein
MEDVLIGAQMTFEFMEEEVLIVDEMALRFEIRRLLKEGVYHQNDLFDILYPMCALHYSQLRKIIHEEKGNA